MGQACCSRRRPFFYGADHDDDADLNEGWKKWSSLNHKATMARPAHSYTPPSYESVRSASPTEPAPDAATQSAPCSPMALGNGTRRDLAIVARRPNDVALGIAAAPTHL
ncbi:hypothetical protein SDRG_04449 [Saprolegnia diclina VS20]|uniref:Uncharacterized protein n=1 Tax=Saprolegnia diclina (strain VS20) TaxID=1156394 RepID=T0QJ51_SAPDV|nr:hypothetical protein SDRG_04449 [Saprolegnia diclina VS20]EQC38019.1 hypothetical protein SDRG_04449 [Saprolegnia diclina VS20]|eukprot:XP_008608346.1 hypothetical protein SDRG_04449 [Saprolegnia diclina VS20]